MFILVGATACGGGDPTPPPVPGGRTPAATALTGQLDPAFGTDGKVTTDFGSENEEVHALVVQPDGKIVAAGSSWPDLGPHFTLARYGADGTLDPSFGDGGTAMQDFVLSSADYALQLLPDGTLAAVGYMDDNDFGLALFRPDGGLINTVGKKGKVIARFGPYRDTAYAVALQPDSKIVAGGSAPVDPKNILNGDFALARFR